jgi:hypothetical protein
VQYAIEAEDDIDGLGMVFDETTGEYEITPTQSGIYTFDVVATNAVSCITGKLSVVITVNAA